MKKRSIRLLSLVLAAAMCLSAAPLSVFAEGASGTSVSGTPTAGASGTPAPVTKTYTVTVTNGTVTKASVAEGEEVTFTAADAEKFLCWKGEGLTEAQKKTNPLTLKPSSDLSLEAVNKQPIGKTEVTVSMAFLNGTEAFDPSDITGATVFVMQGGVQAGELNLTGSDTMSLTLPRNDEAGNALAYDLVLQGEAAKKFTLAETSWSFTSDKEERILSLKANSAQCTVKVDEKLLDFFPDRQIKLQLYASTLAGEEAKSQPVTQKDCVLNHDQLQHSWTELPSYAGSDPCTYFPKVVFESALGIQEEELTNEKQADGSYLISHPHAAAEVTYEEIPVSIQWTDEDGQPGGEPQAPVTVHCSLKSGDVSQNFDSLELAPALKKAAGQWEGRISVPRTTLKGAPISFTLSMDEALKAKYTWENPGENATQFTLKKKPAPYRVQVEFQAQDGTSQDSPVDSIQLKVTGGKDQTETITLTKDQAWAAELPQWAGEDTVLSLESPVAAYRAAFSVEGKFHKVIFKRDAGLTSMKVSLAFDYGTASAGKFPQGQDSVKVEIKDGKTKLADVVLTEKAPVMTCELPAAKDYKVEVPAIQGFAESHTLNGNSDAGMELPITYTAEPFKVEAKLASGLAAVVPKDQVLKIQVKNGEEVAAEISLTREAPSGFASLPAYDENGIPVSYTVPETQGNLKVTKNSQGIYVAELSSKPETAEKKVKVSFTDEAGEAIQAPTGLDSLQVKVLGRAKGTDEPFAEAGSLELVRNQKFESPMALPKEDFTGRPMEYKLEAAAVPAGFTASSGETAEALTLTLKSVMQMEEKTIRVIFKDCYGRPAPWPVEKAELTFRAAGLSQNVTVPKNGTNSEGSKKIAIPTMDQSGNALTWAMDAPAEITVDGITYVPKVNGFSVTYTAKARIQIRVFWKDGNDILLKTIPEKQAELKLTWDTGSENLVVNGDGLWTAETVAPGHQAPYNVELLNLPQYDGKMVKTMKDSKHDYIIYFDIRQAVPLKAMLKRTQTGLETHRIRLKVLRNGVELPEELELNKANLWMDHYPDGVERYDPSGKPYTYQVVPVNSDFQVTGSLDEGFVVERVVPNEKELHVTIVWKNKKGEVIEAPSRYKELDIKLDGYHDFKEVSDWSGEVTLTKADKWKLKTTVPAKDAEDRVLKYKATMKSLMPVGYEFSVKGQGTDNIVITLQAKKLSLIPSTGDQFAMGLWLLLGGGALVGLGVYGVMNLHKKKKNK